jgi:hypothetical protein
MGFQMFAEGLRSEGRPTIEPARFADALSLQVKELADLAGVHRTTVAEKPTNPKLQSFLRDALRALSAAAEVSGGDMNRAAYWFRNVPIPEFDHRTAADLVSGGRVDAVIAYLESIEGGSTG